MNASLSAKHLIYYLFRFGDSKKSVVKGAMPDTSTSLARRMNVFRPVWSMTSVSLFSNGLHDVASQPCR